MAEGRDTPDLPRGLIDRRGTPLGKGARLPSLKGPRDLTLGGIPKKVFAPTIPVRKPAEQKDKKTDQSKQDQGDVKPKVEKEKKGRFGKEKSFDNSQRKYKGQNIIHTHSIFEEQGPSTKNVSKASGANRGEGSVGGRFNSKSSSGQTVSKTEVQEDTKQVLDFLLRDDFIDSKEKRDKYMEPVHLPLSKLNLKLEEKPVEVKDDPDADEEMVDAHQSPKSKSADGVLEALTKTDSGEMLFFQFPDCMPGNPVNRAQSDEEGKEEETQTQTQTQTQRLSDFSEGAVGKLVIRKSGKTQLVIGNITMDVSMGTKCGFLQEEETQTQSQTQTQTQRLSDFSEGAVGKLVIRKSGKTQLVIGNITMDVSMGTKCGFLQDVVSIHTAEDSGNLSVLGHIKHRLVCTPDFDSMLNT